MSQSSRLKLRDLRKNGKYTDVRLISKENKSYRAHKIILVSVSPCFERLFEESEDTTVRLHIDQWTLSSVLKYIYLERNDTIEINNMDQAEALLGAADMLEITSLFSRCCTKVEVIWTEKHFMCIASWNHLYANEYTEKLLDKYVKTFFTNILQLNLHLKFDFEHFTLLLEHIPEFSHHSEENAKLVIEAIIKWIKVDLDQRNRHTALLFAKLDIPYLRPATAVKFLSLNLINTNCQVLMHLFTSFLTHRW